MQNTLILDLDKSKNTIFSIKKIALLWRESNTELVKMRAYRYVKVGKLYSIRRGLYAKDKNYNKYEVATKILSDASELLRSPQQGADLFP